MAKPFAVTPLGGEEKKWHVNPDNVVLIRPRMESREFHDEMCGGQHEECGLVMDLGMGCYVGPGDEVTELLFVNTVGSMVCTEKFDKVRELWADALKS